MQAMTKNYIDIFILNQVDHKLLHSI